jgi:hypothetical protein
VSDGQVVLTVGTCDSHCGACGKTCLPWEPAHTSRCGYDQHEGCGAVYTHVTTNYVAAGLAERILEMRPDLIPVGLLIDPILSGYTQTAREGR